MNTQKHTPVDGWHLEGLKAWAPGFGIVYQCPAPHDRNDPEAHANAAFLLNAAYSHDALVEALERLARWSKHIDNNVTTRKVTEVNPSQWAIFQECIDKAEAALRLARGEDA